MFKEKAPRKGGAFHFISEAGRQNCQPTLTPAAMAEYRQALAAYQSLLDPEE